MSLEFKKEKGINDNDVDPVVFRCVRCQNVMKFGSGFRSPYKRSLCVICEKCDIVVVIENQLTLDAIKEGKRFEL